MATVAPRGHTFDFDAPYQARYDMGSVTGRFCFYFDIALPDNAYYGTRHFSEASKLLHDARCRSAARQHAQWTDAELTEFWRAKRVLHGKFTLDGELIPIPCRVGGWALFGSVPVSALLLTARYRPNSLPLFAAAHWLNQSHIASVSYFNRPGEPVATQTLAAAYVCALSSAVGIFMGWRSLAGRVPALARGGLFAPYPAAAGANVVNTTVMRGQEMIDGIPVLDEHEVQVGMSKIAAATAVRDTCITRILLPAGNFLLTPLAYMFLERATPIGSLLVRYPAMALPTQIMTTVGCFIVAVPGALSVYPPVVSVRAEELEPEIAARVPRGSILYYSKGM